MIRNPAKLREPSKKEGIISSTDSKSVCSQEVVTDLLPETQSLLNVPNGDLVAVKINGSNVQTNGQGIKESKGEVVLTCEFKKGILYSTRRGCPRTAIRGFSSGRPRGTTPADDRYIVLQARRNRRQTAGEIARHTTQATGRPISRFTVARRLHGGGLFARRSVRCEL
ncbi:hypothetical protein TNCV_4990261 [Trichonephila clavipes]|uniref:Transposase Tc1-like domain-containing protein n=1 Tax=Trichonephila clavipes TaxID=2585209 RepID=A0A8X6WBD6_TRICX|nr:hypothetical protein TNCV_4990261 [Trichonephila clavipes]